MRAVSDGFTSKNGHSNKKVNMSGFYLDFSLKPTQINPMQEQIHEHFKNQGEQVCDMALGQSLAPIYW